MFHLSLLQDMRHGATQQHDMAMLSAIAPFSRITADITGTDAVGASAAAMASCCCLSLSWGHRYLEAMGAT